MSMTEFHRKILEKVAPDILNDLDSEDIVPYLVADEAISRHDREKIYTKGTRREKVAALLDILPRRGDGAYISLLSSLTKADGSMHLYEIMKKHEQWVSDQLQQELKEEKLPLQDDTGNNEGNDDQLTSLKQDSGSNQDDITFGGLSAPPEILARGLRARRAYAEAAQAGTKKVFRTRLMLVGQELVGKTSLKNALTGQGIEATERVETNDCEISIEVAKAGGRLWSIHKREDEYNKAIAEEIAKRLFVTPPQDQESLEPLSDSNDGRGLNPNEADFVLDNVEVPKAKEEDDNMPNQIASLVEKMLKEQVHLKEKRTDSTDSGRGEGVSLAIWDFAGRDVFYTTHQVFLTWRAIYVVVFDLSRSLDSVVPPESRDEYYEMVKGGAKSELTCLEFINFWLCSIFAHAVAPSSVRSKNTSKRAQISPPIFIVGTHRESVKGDAKEKKEKIGSAFKKIRQSIMKRPFECQVVPKYYAIENSLEDKDEELVALRRHIEEVAMEEPYMGEEIPLRWLLFEEALAADEINYMSLDQMKEMTQPVGIESECELPTMLTFYHDLGYVVYYGGIEDQQSPLRDMVILNPQWLINVFKQVITILDPAKRDGMLCDAWITLEEDGILEDRLIQHIWQGFLEQKEALVKIMAKFDLICEAPVERLQQEPQDGVDTEVSNETEKVIKKRYYVPSRLMSHCSLEEIGQIKSSTDFYVDFRGFLPDGLFHRLMTRAVRWMNERDGQPVNLFYRHISLMVDKEHHALIEMLPPLEATIKVTVFREANSDDDGDSNKPPAPRFVKEVMDFVTSTLDSLRQHWAKRIQYDVCFLCPKCSKKKLFRDCFKRESLQCGLHRIRTAAVKSKFGMSEEGLESGNKSPVMPRRSIPGSIIAQQSLRTPPQKTNVNRMNAKGETPLHLACFKNDITRVRELLNEPDIDVNARDNAGWTPLHEACNHGHTACVEELLKFTPGKRTITNPGTETGRPTLDFLAAPSECGTTPLHDAVINNQIEVVKLLVEAGGRSLLTVKNKAGFTPVDMALTEVMKEVMLGQMSEVSRLPAVEYENRTDVASMTIHPSRGGSIQLPHHGINLSIPALALQKECEITLKVLPKPSSVFFAPNEANVSSGVVCEPSGTTFEMPLMLVIPHCAVLTDPSKAKVTMHFTNGDTKVTKKELSSTGTPKCVVRENYLEVYINHFSIYGWFMVISDYLIGKCLASTPYLPKSMSCLDPQYCHLCLYNDTPGLGDLIEIEEGKLGYCKMAPTKKMFVYWVKGELKIICEVEGGHVRENDRVQTVSLGEIYRLDQNVLSFLVRANGDALVDFKFNFYPHCDKGPAFLAKFSENRNSTSPRPSTSSSFDTSPQGASAADSGVSTSTEREVSDTMLNKLAKLIPGKDYDTFSEKLSIPHNQARTILEGYCNNYEKATRDCMAIWMNKSTRIVADLHGVLRAADLGGLIVHCD